MGVATFLSLNTHQIGALVWLNVPGLWLIAVCLGWRQWKGEWRQFGWLGIGFVAGGLLYGMEIWKIRYGMVNHTRVHPEPLTYLQVFLRGMSQWFSALLPRDMWDYPVRLTVVTGVLALGALALPGKVSLWRRLLALPLAVVLAMACIVPILFTEGWFGSRILVGAVVAVNGAFALVLLGVRKGWARRLAWGGLALIILAHVAIHVWAFGLLFDIGRLDLHLVERMRSELREAGVVQGDRVTVYGFCTRIREISYGDQGRTTSGLSWSPTFMFVPGFFTETPLPEGIRADFQRRDRLAGSLPPPGAGRFVFPISDGHWGVNSSAVGFGLLRLRAKYMRWAGGDGSLDLRDLVAVGVGEDAWSEQALR